MKKTILFEGIEYRRIPGYPRYYASRTGEIYSEKRKKLLMKQDNGSGYYIVIITLNGVQTSACVHKLVALAYKRIPKKYGLTINNVINTYHSRELVVDHIDGDKHNNNYKNLRWFSNYENYNADNWDHDSKSEKLKGNKNACGKKKSSSKVRYIYTLDGVDYESIKELMKVLKCCKSKITEAFRKNYGLVKTGRLTRRPKTNETKRVLTQEIDENK